MPDQIEHKPCDNSTLEAIGLTVNDLRYLNLRGNGLTRSQALRSDLSGFRLNKTKADRLYERFVGRTGWSEEQQAQIGKLIVEGTRPVATAPPSCPTCSTKEPELFCLYPIEALCDKCLATKIADFLVAEKAERLERSRLNAKLGAALSKAKKEVVEAGRLSFPTADVLMTGAVEMSGGWENVIQAYSTAILSGTPRERFQAAKEIFSYAMMREKQTAPTLDITGCENPEQMKRLIADALISQWHRKRERVALRDLIPQYGGEVPEEGDNNEPAE